MSDTKLLNLGQFDTPKHIAKKLIELSEVKFTKFIDCGAGLGNLSATLDQNNGIAIEVDSCRCDFLRKANIRVLECNFLDTAFSLNSITDETETFFLSNPPFHKESHIYNFKYFDSLKNLKTKAQLDVAFLDKVLSTTKTNDSILFIMSSPFFESDAFSEARFQMFNSFNCIKLISLPKRLFPKADVQSYALIAHNLKEKSDSIEFYEMSINGDITIKKPIKKSETKLNLNSKFQQDYLAVNQLINDSSSTLLQLGCEVIRGSMSKHQFKEIGVNHFIHTTNIGEADKITMDNVKREKIKTARIGDILIPRIGGGIISKAHLVQNNELYFTESVYRIRPPKDKVDVVWQAISCELGIKWRELNMQGKCAKFLTVDAVLNLPVNLPMH